MGDFGNVLTDIVHCQTSKGIRRRVDECVIGIDELVVAEPDRVVFERMLEELADEIVATDVQVEQSKLPGRGWPCLGDVSFVTISPDVRRVDRELVELRQTIEDPEEGPRSNVRYVERDTRQRVRDRSKHLSDGGRILLRRTGFRNELSDLEGFQHTSTIRRQTFRYLQNLICTPLVRIFTPHERKPPNRRVSVPPRRFPSLDLVWGQRQDRGRGFGSRFEIRFAGHVCMCVLELEGCDLGGARSSID